MALDCMRSKSPGGSTGAVFGVLIAKPLGWWRDKAAEE